MATEIERKFLVHIDKVPLDATKSVYIRQGFLTATKERVVRVRVSGEKATLTIKGKTVGLSKLEYEYEIPKDDAMDMLHKLCDPSQIIKTRYLIPYHGATALRMEVTDESALVWEVDVFHGDNKGLVVAEIELESEDQEIHLPDWIGEEVSDDPRYFNSQMIKHPFKDWDKN